MFRILSNLISNVETIDKYLYCLEGSECVGKSSICSKLKSEYTVFRLPGGSKIGEEIRELLKDRKIERCSITDYYLLNASDSEIFHREILNLPFGTKVLLDRGFISRIIYQGIIEHISMSKIVSDILFSWNNIIPVKTAILYCSEKTLAQRMKSRYKDNWYDERAIEINYQYNRLCESIKNIKLEKYFRPIDTSDLTLDQVTEKVQEYFNEN